MNSPNQFLLIDDDSDDHEIFEEALKLAFPHAECNFALDCPEAIALLVNKAIPVPDCIFMDWNLPKLPGIVCVEQLRQVIDPTKTKLFILTGSVPLSDPMLTNATVVNGILTKQNSLAKLAKEIASVIN